MRPELATCTVTSRSATFTRAANRFNRATNLPSTSSECSLTAPFRSLKSQDLILSVAEDRGQITGTNDLRRCCYLDTLLVEAR
jgi:hypothetical protein